MPWITLWIDPVPFTRHRDVTIYHTYNDMEARRGFHFYRFTTAAKDADPQFYFDVRELPLASVARLAALDPKAAVATEQAIILDIIIEAIDCGILRQNECPRVSAKAA